MAVKGPEVKDPRFVEGTVVTLEDVESKYNHLIYADKEYNEEWSTHVRLSPEAATAMAKIGFNVKVEDDGSCWLKAKKVCTTRNGKKQDAPDVFLNDGTKCTEDPGDGSTFKEIKLWCKYTPPIKGQIYMSAYINKVVIDKFKKKPAKVTF